MVCYGKATDVYLGEGADYWSFGMLKGRFCRILLRIVITTTNMLWLCWYVRLHNASKVAPRNDSFEPEDPIVIIRMPDDRYGRTFVYLCGVWFATGVHRLGIAFRWVNNVMLCFM